MQGFTQMKYLLIQTLCILSIMAEEEIIFRVKRNDDITTSSLWSQAKGYFTTLETAIRAMPAHVRDAFMKQNFVNVTDKDYRELNASAIELLPPSTIQNLSVSVLSPLLDTLIANNRPTGIARLIEYGGNQIDSTLILNKFDNMGNAGIMDKNDEVKRIMLYSAMEKLGNESKINDDIVRSLERRHMLESVPPSQFVTVKDNITAKLLIERLYDDDGGRYNRHKNDMEEHALLVKLAIIGYGESKRWTVSTIKELIDYVPSFPYSVLKDLKNDTIYQSLKLFHDVRFEWPLQGRVLAEKCLQGHDSDMSEPQFKNLTNKLGNLVAFLPPYFVNNLPPTTRTLALKQVVSKMEELGQNVPIQLSKELLNDKLSEKPIEALGTQDARNMGATLLSIMAPSFIQKVKDWKVFDKETIIHIANFANNYIGHGLINQISVIIQRTFSRGGHIDLGSLPSTFIGLVPIRELQRVTRDDIIKTMKNLDNNPNSLNPAQKGVLLQKIRDDGLILHSNLPAEIRFLVPPKALEGRSPEQLKQFVTGLPPHAEQRLSYSIKRVHGRGLTLKDLEQEPSLIAMMSVDDVKAIDLEDIPGVLVSVKNAPEGPSTQVLWALKNKLGEHLKRKSGANTEEPLEDRIQFRQMSAAEFVNIPGSVLALYDQDALTDHMVSAEKKKEILIALGDLRKEDYMKVPRFQRETIVHEGLKALYSARGTVVSALKRKKRRMVGKSNRLDYEKLTAIGNAVQDLPPNWLEKLTPIALEEALPVLQGMENKEENNLKLKACLTDDQRYSLEKRILAVYGASKHWDYATMATLCCSLDILSEDTLSHIPNAVFLDCHCESELPPLAHLEDIREFAITTCLRELGDHRALERHSDRVETQRAHAAKKVADEIILSRRRRRRRSVSWRLSCEAVRLAGNGAAFSGSQLETMDPKDVPNCIFELGRQRLCKKRSGILWKKLVQHYNGNPFNAPADVLRNSGWVSRGFLAAQASLLPLADLDVVATFGQYRAMTREQLQGLARSVKKAWGSKVSAAYTAEDLVILGHIVCGFDEEDLGRLKPETYIGASTILKRLRHCQPEALSGLAALSKAHNAYGEPKYWTAVEVASVGAIFGGLTPNDVRIIPPTSFRGLSAIAVESMPNNLISALSHVQIQHFSREAAQALHYKQTDALDDRERETVKALADGMRGLNKGLQFSTASWTTLVSSAIMALSVQILITV